MTQSDGTDGSGKCRPVGRRVASARDRNPATLSRRASVASCRTRAAADGRRPSSRCTAARPLFGGEDRVRALGRSCVMADKDWRIGDALVDVLRAETDLRVGVNEPYTVDVEADYTSRPCRSDGPALCRDRDPAGSDRGRRRAAGMGRAVWPTSSRARSRSRACLRDDAEDPPAALRRRAQGGRMRRSAAGAERPARFHRGRAPGRATPCSTDYPMPGSRRSPASPRRAGTSGPTILRFVHRLGFETYADFQDALRTEIQIRLQGPLAALRRRYRDADGRGP